jgi:hypothetical protein
VEHAARLAEDPEKLSTHFGALADLVREAHFWARQAGAPLVHATHVQPEMPAGARGADGRFPGGSVDERVEQRLRTFAQCVKELQAVGAVEGRKMAEPAEHLGAVRLENGRAMTGGQ